MLENYIKETCSDPFEWGVNDCAMWCASAVFEATGYDPASDLRGTYNSKATCDLLVMKSGGLENLIAPRMDADCLRPMQGVEDGFAIIRIGSVTLCALIVGGRAASKADASVRFFDNYKIIRGFSWRKH